MNFIILLSILSLVAIANGQSTNWCSVQNCSPNQHIACINNKGVFASNCNSPKAIPLSSAEKQKLLDLHNSYRNQVASGKLAGFATAKRMAKVVWNDQLAYFAELNTKQCQMKHDACHNTPNLKFSGQNLAMMANTGTYTTDNVISGSMSMWFNEYKDTTMTNINKVGTSSNGKAIGHFTALVTDRTTQIGCAISSYRYLSGTTWFNAYLLACNYASTNMINCPVYKTGPVAQSCTKGPDVTYKGLCKTSEPIDPNSIC